MKNIKYLFVALIFLVGCESTDSSQEKLAANITRVETSLSPEVYIEGDSLWTMEERMKHYGVPGVSIAVIYNNEIAWSKAYGVVDKTSQLPVTKETLFQAGSISKPVAAYGALKVAELGKISLEENVNTYLTSWQLPDNDITKEKKVSLQDILSHTGGVTVHGFLGYSPDLPVPTLIQVLNGEKPANSPPIRVDKTPEKSFRYSGGGYTIMQQMLIDVEGKPFPELMDDLVLSKLGMSHSTYNQPLTGEPLTMAATGYLPNGNETKGKRHTYPEMAAAGLWTTAEDLAKFAIDIQKTVKGETSKVLTQPAVKRMLTPFVEDFVGLGIFIDKKKKDIYFQHGGWDEGFSSQLMAHKDKGYGVVILTNSNHPDFIDELIRSVAITYKWDNYLPTYEGMAMVQADKNAIVGRYHYDTDEVVTVYESGDKVFFKYLRTEPMEVVKVSDTLFVRRERRTPFQFKTNPSNGKQYLVFITEGDPIEFKYSKMEENEKAPYEWLREGNEDKALSAYKELAKANPDDPFVLESTLNNDGYSLMSSGEIKLAKALFKINIGLYPKSANTYDSYAEACMKNGDTKLAIDNYKKSLALNPENDNAKAMLKELQASK